MEPEFTLTRIFEAPLKNVFDAYSQEEHLCNWWGSIPFDLTICELDFQPNGRFFYGLASSSFKVYGVFDFLEMDAPNMIRFINYVADKNGFPIRHPRSETWPIKMINTYRFVEMDEKTELTIEISPFEAGKEELKTFRDGLAQIEIGLKGSLDKLEEYLTTMD